MTTQEQALEQARKALNQIKSWIGFPDTGERWPNGQPMSYGACYGSNGERDYMREIAKQALVAIANVTPASCVCGESGTENTVHRKDGPCYQAEVACTPPVDDAYYLQDRRTYVGNCVMWWGKDAKGYTTRLNEAHRHTKEEAFAQHKVRGTDVPWRCSVIDPLQHPTIDVQDLHKAMQAKEPK